MSGGSRREPPHSQIFAASADLSEAIIHAMQYHSVINVKQYQAAPGTDIPRTREMPGWDMVTPYQTGAASIVVGLCVITII